MHSIIYIVGVVVTGKENYPEWSRKIKHTLIFNELWKGVCVGDGDKEPEQPTSDKEFTIWENKNNKTYALIAASVSEEVSHHISPFSNAFEALQKLNELYDSHSALEVVQLIIKLFTLELQNNDALALASEVKSIMHDIKATKPGPFEKGPLKWLTRTLESVHPDEVGKTGTRNSNRKNGGDVDDSDSLVDMDVSYDCELNLSTDFEPTSFKEAASHDEWKESMQKEYDALIKNGTWNLVDPPLGTKPIGCKWVYKNKYKADGSLDKHKARLVEKGFA
eukprot:PITA_14986